MPPSSEFAEIHDELRSVGRDLLARSAQQHDVDWKLLASSGWLGLEVPEELDGAGATFAEVAVIIEEMGRAATGGAYLGTVVLGVGTLLAVAPAPDRDELLRAVANGATTVAVALPTGDDLASGDLPFRIENLGDGLRLVGRADFVPDAAQAERLLVVAAGLEGRPVVVEVPPGSAGLTIEDQPVLDATRRVASVVADEVVVGPAAWWSFAGDAEAAVRGLVDRASVAIALDSLGIAEAMVELTVEYAKVREQFARPIGSFQAVKHQCADMLVSTTVARQLVGQAIAALVEGPGGDAEASVAASRAKSYATEAAMDVVGKALQLHGGIGYTWESGIHVFFKRAALDRSLFGSPTAHRRRLAARYA